MRVKDLQDELKKHGLVKRGKQPELILCSKQAMFDRVVIMDKSAPPTNNVTSSSEIPGFIEGEYWEELLPQSAPVEELTNSF
eukprot:6105638-Ditylum_brightwellii.AAC.1